MKKIRSKVVKFGIASVSAIVAVFIIVASIGAPVAKAQFSSNAAGLAGLIAVDNIVVGNSGSLTGGTSNLADLIVLSGLFPTSTNANQNAKNLAGLIAVDNITGNGGTSGGAFTSGTSNLADLIVLQGLFPTSTNANQNAKDLAGLIAVSNVTGGGTSGGAFTNNSGNLGGEIVLYNLFLDP